MTEAPAYGQVRQLKGDPFRYRFLVLCPTGWAESWHVLLLAGDRGAEIVPHTIEFIEAETRVVERLA